MTAPAPLCFVLMPFGRKVDSAGLTIDFDSVYRDVIKPAIAETGLDPLRADEEMTGGVIHKPMYERLILCPFAVADLTTANANVFYELGVRHAVRPASTVLLFAEGSRLPFDVAPLRAILYRLTADGKPADPSLAQASLASKLREARRATSLHEKPIVDSPIYQLVESFPDVQHLKTDVFRERVEYARSQKEALTKARSQGLAAVEEFEQSLGDTLDGLESGVLVDLFLTYRAVKGWPQMIELARRMPRPLAATVMIQEQLALALNRAGRDEQAEAVLQSLLANRGPSSETLGILGRIYKDRWERSKNGGRIYEARGYLEKAIEVYSRGFEADWRDAYPGINAVTLMELRDSPDPRQVELLPLVTFAAKRRIAVGKPDYWDYATLLELAVLARNGDLALDWLGRSLAHVRETWEPETTCRNIQLIADARRNRGEAIPEWLVAVLAQLRQRAA